MKKPTARIVSFVSALLILLVSTTAWLIISLSITKERIIAAPIEQSSKPVIMLLYDSLMHEPLQQAIQSGDAPAFSYLIKHGTYYSEVVSSYPTMSVAIDSTILTGTYADKHHVPGLLWFNEQEQKLVSYGSGPHEIRDNGIKEVLQNGVLKLNSEHLSRDVRTIYERLDELGMQCASINGIIYRGNTPHELHIPGLLTRSQMMPHEVTMNGPTLLSLGVMSQYNKGNDQNNYAWNRLGINNEFTINELAYFIQEDKLPPFTLAYLPDADAKLHRKGPSDVEAIKQADEALQKALNLYPSWQEALDEAIWIVLGDSGQSLVESDKKQALIDMNEVLSGYSLWSHKKQNGQLAFALNERMGYIHIRDDKLSRDEIVQKLKQEKRLQFIAWQEDGKNYVAGPESEQLLVYSRGGSYRDEYGQTWQLEGDLSLLDLYIADHQVQYNDYPDALARLHGALHAQQGNIIVIDAKPSYEIVEHSSYNHVGGGSHGSLHKADSLVPLIVTGTDTPLEDQRLVALQKWLMSLLLQQRP